MRGAIDWETARARRAMTSTSCGRIDRRPARRDARCRLLRLAMPSLSRAGKDAGPRVRFQRAKNARIVEYVIATRLVEFLCTFIEPTASRLRLHAPFAAPFARPSARPSPLVDARSTQHSPS